ncbi:hypothetical protein G113_03569 [Aeromonas molluscorum 848]|uniref:Uncharacterized protein n=1 Tax=Aeromonas molluscorum 848 TaxID=1268236 RepID=R1GYD8_9GAMM|nr:hypothetical protein G113_03569 [Aeromonas molluscorum 848]
MVFCTRSQSHQAWPRIIRIEKEWPWPLLFIFVALMNSIVMAPLTQPGAMPVGDAVMGQNANADDRFGVIQAAKMTRGSARHSLLHEACDHQNGRWPGT